MTSKTNRRRRAPVPQPVEEARRMWAAGGLLALVVGCLLLAAALEVEPRQDAEFSSVVRPVETESRETADASPEALSLPERARRDARRLGMSPDQWTLQLMMVCDADTLRTTVDSVGEVEELFVMAAPDQGGDCYRVFWGLYSDREGAARATDLPSGVLAAGEKGWPRPVSQVLSR